MELKHKIYHVTKDRITITVSVLWAIAWIACFHYGLCDFKWLLFMLMLNTYAYTFRRALKGLQ